MENKPFVNIRGINPYPGVDIQTWNRFEQWRDEVYFSLYMKVPGRTGIDLYKIIRESPEYPPVLFIIHNESKVREVPLTNPDSIAVAGEMASWIKRRVMEYVWNACYVLIKSFRDETRRAYGLEDTKIENAPILHIEGYHFRQEDKEKHLNWLSDYAFSSFIPLFMGFPGIKGYDCYNNIGMRYLVEPREWEYPSFLSALYFEDIDSFENYTRSPELLAFQKAVHSVFPNGLNLRWYVQYQLVKSWRK